MGWKKWKKNPYVKAGAIGLGVAGLTLAAPYLLPAAAGAGAAGIGGLGTAGGLGLGAAGLYGTFKNFDLQQKNYEKQWESYETQLAREDTSIARRVSDLKAAGLSPVLAAGSGATSQAVFTGKAPQMDNPLEPIAGVLGLLKMKEDISNTMAQRMLINQQTKTSTAQEKQLKASASYMLKQAGLKNIELENANQTGNAGTSLPGRMFNDLTGATTKSIETLKNSIDTQVEELKEKASRWGKPSYSDDYYKIERSKRNNRR